MATSTENPVHVPAGMPQLDISGSTTSRFEFWPLWVMYLPVALQWLWLGLRYRNLMLPLIANPAIPLSGMVGVPKSCVFNVAGELARRYILPWAEYRVGLAPVARQCENVLLVLERSGLGLPVVGKPSIGCRGAGVRLLKSEAELAAYLGGFPPGATILFQQLAGWEAEAGVFYVRHPEEERGRVTSLTLKYTPYVVGDGVATLAELVAADPRAGKLAHLYRERHAASWNSVIAAGLPYRLVFSASHCRGAVFRDGSRYITAALSQELDRIFDDIPGFHYGRLDVKFRDLESLMAGRDFVIMEINGASSESIHIWDRDATLPAALSTLTEQYKTLFHLGDANRRRGHAAPPLSALWRAWRHEAELVARYPRND